MLPRRFVQSSLVLLTCLLAGCGGPDVAGVFIVMEPDGSALITARSLLPQTDAGPLEGATEGVEWTDRVRLVSSRGRVADLGALRIDEIRFHREAERLRVEIPCGPEATWIERLAPSPEARLAAVRTFDPLNEESDLGSRVSFQVEVPGRVIATGAGPEIGVQTAQERRRATLTILVRTAREIDRTVTWDVTWR